VVYGDDLFCFARPTTLLVRVLPNLKDGDKTTETIIHQEIKPQNDEENKMRLVVASAAEYLHPSNKKQPIKRSCPASAITRSSETRSKDLRNEPLQPLGIPRLFLKPHKPSEDEVDKTWISPPNAHGFKRFFQTTTNVKRDANNFALCVLCHQSFREAMTV